MLVKLFKKAHPIVKFVYIPRIVGHFSVGLLVCFTLLAQNRFSYNILLVFVFLSTLWPQLILYFTSTHKDPKWAEHTILCFESFLIGLWIALIGFSYWVSTVIITCMLSAKFSIGGFSLFFRGALATIVGAIIGVFIFGVHFYPDSDIKTILTAIVTASIFLYSIGIILHVWHVKTKSVKLKIKDTFSELNQINELLTKSNASLRIENVIEIFIEFIRKYIYEFDIIALALANDNYTQWKFQTISGQGISETEIDQLLAINFSGDEECLLTSVNKSNQYQYYPEINVETLCPLDKKIHAIIGFKSIGIYPLSINQKNQGMIFFMNKETAFLPDKKLKMIATYIKQVNLTIYNALVYEKLKEKRIELDKKD